MIRFQGHLGNQTLKETGWVYGGAGGGWQTAWITGASMGRQSSPYSAFPRVWDVASSRAAWPSDISSSPAVLPGPFPTHPSNPSAITRRRQTLCFLYRGRIRMWSPPGAVVGWVSPGGPANREQPACPQANCRPLDSHPTTSLMGRGCKTLLSKSFPSGPGPPCQQLGAGTGLQPKALTW